MPCSGTPADSPSDPPHRAPSLPLSVFAAPSAQLFCRRRDAAGAVPPGGVSGRRRRSLPRLFPAAVAAGGLGLQEPLHLVLKRPQQRMEPAVLRVMLPGMRESRLKPAPDLKRG